ncbi:hypothetical protein ACIB24_20405 [Spongisporangium articulatum]|uniref:Uncharacterized protein n=1 Tax=Spongisporangium articulatum TaxID=3362603 RepID=A0ABW8ATW7_9ACTN
MTSPPPPKGQVVRYATLMGLVVGGLAGVGIVALMSIDYLHYRGAPAEQAESPDPT